MNKAPLDYAIVGYSPDLYHNHNREPEGIWIEHLKVLSKYMNLTPQIKTNFSSFTQHVKEIEQGNARIGSPQVASFQ